MENRAEYLSQNQASTINDHVLEKEFVDRMRQSNYLLAKEVDTNKNQINNLRSTVNAQNYKLSEYSVGSDLMSHQHTNLAKEIELLKRENEILKTENFRLKSQNDEIINTRKNEGFSLLENENLKTEISRLFQMLKTTKEFKDLSKKADASGSINYLAQIGKFSKVDMAVKYKELKNLDCHRPDLFVDESLLWVPSEAFKFAHEFRIKYDGKLTDTLIEHLLFELNKIWSTREQRLLGEQKKKYSSAAEQLRRKTNLITNGPLELVNAQKEIQRLKGLLKNAYKENRDAHADRLKRNPEGVKQIQEALKMANNHCTDKIKMRKDNEYHKTVTCAYNRALTDDYKGNLFLAEGSKMCAKENFNGAKELEKDLTDMLFGYDRDLGGGNEFSGDGKTSIEDTTKRESMIYQVLKRVGGFCETARE
jgi:hypothetical protein